MKVRLRKIDHLSDKKMPGIYEIPNAQLNAIRKQQLKLRALCQKKKETRLVP